MKNMRNVINTKFSLLDILVLLVFLGGIIDDDLIFLLNVGLILVFRKHLIFSYKMLFLYVMLIVQDIVSIMMGYAEAGFAIKQLVGIMLSMELFYSCIRTKADALHIFGVYKTFSMLMAILCIMQQGAFKIGISFIYDLRWLVPEQRNLDLSVQYRSYALFDEPSQTALILLPTAALALYRLFGKNRKEVAEMMKTKEAFVMLLGFFCIFSTSGYLGLVAMGILIVFEYKFDFRSLLFVLLAICVMAVVWFRDNGFRMRIVDTIQGFNMEVDIDGLNLSTQSIVINAKVAFKSLVDSFGLGKGIGSHPISYDLFSGIEQYSGYRLNRMDAGAMVIRLISETGLWGITIFFNFLYRYRPKSKDIYGVIGMCCLSYIIQRLLKVPHGFNDGLWMMVMIYACVGKVQQEHRMEMNIYESQKLTTYFT